MPPYTCAARGDFDYFYDQYYPTNWIEEESYYNNVQFGRKVWSKPRYRVKAKSERINND